MATPAVQVVRAIPEHTDYGKESCDNNSISDLTHAEVQLVVNRAVNRDAIVRNFTLLPYSEGKLGFLGTHLRLSVDVQTNTGKQTLNFFVKSVPYNVPTQAEYVINKGVFEKETAFYCEIVTHLQQGSTCESWMPACYLVKSDLIVLEDLSDKNYTMEKKLFNKEQVASGLAALARMHATSLLTEARLGKSLKTIYPYAFEEKAFSRTGKTRQWFDVGIKAAVAVAKHLGLDASMIPTACEEVFPAIESSPTKRNVISHGDLWGNNLMFSNDVPPKCLLIDYQLVRYSPIAHDVIQFLYLCANRKFRELSEETMLKHYYSVLRETVNTSGASIEIPSWSEFVEGVQEQRLGAVITAVLYFPTVLMDENLGAEIMNDPVSYQEYVFHSRDDIVLENMKNDPEYGERIEEVVRELVELSHRLGELPKPS